jgi:hypothetical protein
MHYFEVSKLRCIHSTLVDPKWCLWVFWTTSLTFTPEKMKTRVLGLNALFQGSKVAKHPFYYIGPKMMFGSVSEHFAYLRHIKRCNSCVSGLNALIRGIEVAMHPFYSGWPKMIFGSVLDHLLTLGPKKMKTSCFGPECTILGLQSCKTSILLHSTQNDVWVCFGAFR